MSASMKELLANLAVSQAVLVAPALGDSYAGKSAGTIAGLLMMLAQDAIGYAERRVRAREAIAEILGAAAIDDRALAEDIRMLLDKSAAGGADDRLERLLMAFTLVHEWADRNDAALARHCRDFLADWTAGDLLAPPALPGT